MGNGGHGEVEELQGELDDDSQGLGEHDDGQGDLAVHDRTLSQLIRQGEQAGFGGQTSGLKAARKALRRTRQYVAEAEERGRQRALDEFAAGNEQAVTALRDQVRAELQVETSRERSLARLGVPEGSPVRSLFDSIQGSDHKAYEQHADLLRAAGVSWSADPVVQQAAAARVQAWGQAAEQAAGNGSVDLGQPGVAPEVRDRLVAEAVGQMAGAQAGSAPHNPQSPLEAQIEKGQRRPELLDNADYREALADTMNRELSGLAQTLRGGAWQ